MKKYLMTGIAAVAMCAAFTSCSHDLDFDQSSVENAVQSKYEAAFIKAFGQPAADQDWGFGTTRGITRNNGIDNAINVNGNQWTECPGVRVNEEVDAIFNYVKNGTDWMKANNKPFSTTAPENLNGYFVTQVRSGNNNYADNTYTNIYNNNQVVTNVGSWMNHLQIAFNQNPSMADLNNATSHDNISGWQHINNFNGSSNVDWGASDSKEKGNTKVENKGAFDFAYYNSLDSKYHNKWILVDGANISSDPYYADFYYVCFDFESVPSTNKTHYHYKDSSGQSQNGELDGTYFTNAEVVARLKEMGITNRTDIEIYRWEQGDKMLKGDNVYSDWIIRITKGAPEETEDYDGRIMAEDLTAREDGDFDFNDVVFDYKLLNNGKAKIKLRAAGGTLELYVGGTGNEGMTEITGGKEVHTQFGVPINQMVNTGVTTVAEPAAFEVDCENDLPVNIKIWVKKGGKFFELTAHTGQPASKFHTSCLTKWCDEYISISNPYPTFKDWVGSTSFAEWATTNFNSIFADQKLDNNSGAIKGGY